MQYILTTQEYDALTPVNRLQDRNEALEIARSIILVASGYPCGKGYCDDCPIFTMASRRAEHSNKPLYYYICIRNKHLSK